MEVLDTVNKDEEEEEDESQVSQSHIGKETMLIAKVVFQELLHCNTAFSRDLDRFVVLSKLGCHKTIYGPSYRVTPAIPSPPYRH